MSQLITDSHRIMLDSDGNHVRTTAISGTVTLSGCTVRTTVVAGMVTLSARDDTDHTLLDLTADQARELGTKLITFASYAEANMRQMLS